MIESATGESSVADDSPFSSIRRMNASTNFWGSAGMEDDEEANRITFPYRKAMMNHPATERSSLLGKRRRKVQVKDFVHPLMSREEAESKDKKRTSLKYYVLMIWLFGVHMSCMVLHDLYLSYLSYRRNVDIGVKMWSLPWLAPSSRSLINFGALSRSHLFNGEYWRIVTSSIMCTNLLELIMVLLAWYHAKPRISIVVAVFIIGPLWFLAFDAGEVTGTAAVASLGELTLHGMEHRKNHKRWNLATSLTILFLLAMEVAWLRPYPCPASALGSLFLGFLSFFGRAANIWQQSMSIMLIIILGILPTCWIAWTVQ